MLWIMHYFEFGIFKVSIKRVDTEPGLCDDRISLLWYYNIVIVIYN